MIRLALLLFSALSPATAVAAPLPLPAAASIAAPAPERVPDLVPDSLTTSYVVDGITVIQRRASNDVVAANLYLLGGSRQITPQTAGVEALLLAASERGTGTYSRDEIRLMADMTGSSFVIDPSPDWTLFGFRGIRSAFDSTWAVFADRLMNPTLEPAELELVRAQLLAGIEGRHDDPDALVEHLADSLTFAGHPYETPTIGTAASIRGLSADELRHYHEDQFVTSRMLLVVVGDIERAHLEQLIHRTIGKLPKGSYEWTLPAQPPGEAAELVVEPRQLPTNYILGYYAGPDASSRDYPALRLATSILSGRLFQEIRSRRNLTYAVSAPLLDRAISSGGLYVTTVDPETTVGLMRTEVRRLQNELIDPDALPEMIQLFVTDYFLNNETNAAQADFLARAQLYKGDYQEADRFVSSLRRVTNDDIRRVARRYMKDMHFAYVGDPTQAPRELLERF